MAKAPEAIYSKFIEIIDKYEKGDLKGQKTQTTDAQGGLKEAKVYYFRHINSMEEEAAHAVLDLVLSGDMKLTSLEKKSREVETLMKIKSAFMGELNRMGESFTMWKEVVDRFPKHTGDDQLTNMFGQVCEIKSIK